MISRPSCEQLVAVVRREFSQTIAPQIPNVQLSGLLSMIDAILQSVETRCGHEIAWMKEEISDIEQFAEVLIADSVVTTGEIAEALAQLHARRSTHDHFVQVQAEYSAAGEVLSRALEYSMATGGIRRQQAEALLRQRLAREVEIRGAWQMVSRS